MGERTDERRPHEGPERIDWDEMGGGSLLGYRDLAFAGSLLAIAAAFYYVRYRAPEYEPLPIIGTWDPLLVDWVFMGSLSAVVFYLLVPLARSPGLALTYWRRFRRSRVAVVGLVWLAVFFALGVLEPFIVQRSEATFAPIHQPPVGIGVYEGFVGSCVGEVANEMCHGSLEHPLGTTGGGKDVLSLTISGMRVALEVSIITATILVPLGTAVGTVAAYAGGWTDEVLMRYVDIQGTIPALFIYMVAQFVYGPSLMLMIVIFGFLSWGDLARVVRSEALQKAEEEYVRAARSAGGDSTGIIRRHILPNVSSTVLTTAALQLPLLVIVEATLSYLKLGDPRLTSWGNLASVELLANTDPTVYWWIPTAPIVALVLTAVSMNLVGSALQDALDPRRGA